MYSQASSTDGAARIAVDPAQTYDLVGMAPDKGWPHSPTIRRLGSDIPEGHVFLVNGPPD